MAEEQQDLWVAIRHWRRRPFTHAFAMAVAAVGPIEVIGELLTSGITDLFVSIAIIVATAVTAGAITSLFGGPWTYTAMTWEDTSLSSATVDLSLPHGTALEGWSTIGATVWLGWALGALFMAASGVLTGSIEFKYLLFASPLLFSWTMLPSIYLVGLGPLHLAPHFTPRSVRNRTQRIQLEGRTLSVGGERFHVGRSEQQVRLREAEIGFELVLSNADERVVIRGQSQDLERIAQWVQRQGKRGDRSAVPDQLHRARE